MLRCSLPDDVFPPIYDLYVASTVLAGDYNNDGVVNIADYAVWRDNVGATAGALVNDVDGGTIGAAQYATWKTNFGVALSATASIAGSSVPEPATSLMLAVAAAMVAVGVRSRCR